MPPTATAYSLAVWLFFPCLHSFLYPSVYHFNRWQQLTSILTRKSRSVISLSDTHTDVDMVTDSSVALRSCIGRIINVKKSRRSFLLSLAVEFKEWQKETTAQSDERWILAQEKISLFDCIRISIKHFNVQIELLHTGISSNLRHWSFFVAGDFSSQSVVTFKRKILGVQMKLHLDSFPFIFFFFFWETKASEAVWLLLGNA